jgi:hypothetical protein
MSGQCLSWGEDRWHLGGRPIHAGAAIEVRWPDGTWEQVRVESADRGRRLYAHGIHYHGVDLSIRLDEDYYALRWPA